MQEAAINKYHTLHLQTVFYIQNTNVGIHMQQSKLFSMYYKSIPRLSMTRKYKLLHETCFDIVRVWIKKIYFLTKAKITHIFKFIILNHVNSFKHINQSHNQV